MGFESFNAMPAEESEEPKESERIDDVEKAEDVAYAGKKNRDVAVELRKITESESSLDKNSFQYNGNSEVGGKDMSDAEVRVDVARLVGIHDNLADRKENTELKGYDDSERINDPALAEKMARAGKSKREEAAYLRSEVEKLYSGETPIRVEGGQKVVEVAQGIHRYDINTSDTEIRREIEKRLGAIAEQVDQTANSWEQQEKSKE